MTYQTFVRNLERFTEQLGKNGPRIIHRFRKEIALYVLEKKFREDIRNGSDAAFALLTFPNFLPEIPSEAKWNAEFSDGEPGDDDLTLE
jgi:hypothetical protein